ncbi:helix-turn-helix transcriptional regulator [Fodinisporobacter ferrooxydans]|uniref:Helix-turn-helix transcriptional regulator n=1 Tax=Fodinisporobacter ferrooxydans TaxID=2901836 RepID=A0ABY4CQG6_9BACL|nr:helix-turn-helix transcriptional regulator [Alicyclobacillaceae bacterium MYW30-H2]
MNPIDISQIADEFFVTRVHLMRTFKKETGTIINEAITSKRLEEACHLLKNSNLHITEIALMVGFNNSQYFSKLFNETFAATPKTYRKNGRK